VVVDKEKADLWLSRGAQASDTVTNLLVKQGILPATAKVHGFFTPTKKEEAPVVEVAKEVAETPEEAPATEEAAPAAEETVEEPVAEITEEVVEETPEA